MQLQVVVLASLAILLGALAEPPAWVSLLDGREDLMEYVEKAEEQEQYDAANPVDCSLTDELLVLTNKSFHTATRQCPEIFILIHVRDEENPFWNHTELELKAAIAAARLAGHDVVGAVMDLKANVAFVRQQGVMTSHSARLYLSRVFLQYWGSLLRGPIGAFLARAYEPPLVHLNSKLSVEAFKNDSDTKVLVHTDREAPEVLACELAARDYLNSITFYHVTNARLAKVLSIPRDTALIYRPLQAPLPTHDLANIGRVVHSHRVPLLARMRPEDVHLMLPLVGKHPIVFAFVQSNTTMGAALLKAVRAVAKSFARSHPGHPTLSFAWMEVLLFPDVLPSFMAQFGFNMHERHADLGVIDLRTVPAGALWYPIDDEPVTAKAIERWLLRETAGKIRYSYIDQIVPDFFDEEKQKKEAAKANAKDNAKTKRAGKSGAGDPKRGGPASGDGGKTTTPLFHTSIDDNERDEL